MDDITLSLEEATKFLGFKSPQSLCTKARNGEIPGFKAGRQWMFYKPDLINYIRAKYEIYKQNKIKQDEIKGNNVWYLAKRRAHPTGTPGFLSVVSECKNLRAQLREKKRNDMKTAGAQK